MKIKRTGRLSLKDSKKILEEMARPPADTPERRATFERVRQVAEWRERRMLEEAAARK